MIELSQSFGFEAAHTLERAVGAEASRRIHGHSYRAELVLRGEPDARSGMLIDLGTVAATIASLVVRLDHRLLDEVPGLGAATMENLAAFIYRHAKPDLAALTRVVVRRDSIGQSCAYEPSAN